MAERVCKNCKLITTKKQCPICNGTNFGTTWYGKVIITDPENSEIAKELGIKIPGSYALRI